MLVIRARKTVRSEIPREISREAPMVFVEGEFAEADRNALGAVWAIFGQRMLGLKPDEFDVIRDDDNVPGSLTRAIVAEAEIRRLREALQEAADMTEHESDRTLIFNHCMEAAEAGGDNDAFSQR